MKRRKLPIGIQTFREMREGGYYYVDKTGLALRLIEEGKYYFLSRPRRFGKSLFLDTLGELFDGEQGLFVGLAAEHRWDWGRRYPVIRLSFGGGVVKDAEGLAAKIAEQLRINQETLGVRCEEPRPEGCFAELIRKARARFGERVVVLVDEYDKPILDNISDPATARVMRDGLRNLYSVIKDSDAHIRFAFLTGVSKFSKVSLFSGLNNLKDITVDARYSAICGYTEADLDEVFGPELEGLDRELIRAWYNGYNWTGESVYNPFDVLLLFRERKFHPWWFETATPTFLVDVLTSRRVFVPKLGQLLTDEQLLSTFDVDYIATEALLFQTGYLTIAAERQFGATIQYRLRYPNLEVRSSLNNALLHQLRGRSSDTPEQAARLYDLLLTNDFEGLKTLFTAFFDGIPYEWFTKNDIAHYEGYYASVFYAYFASLGLDLTPEESSNAGRLDMALRFNDQIYLFEFKVEEVAGPGSALKQIKDQGYANKYRAQGLAIHLIGVEFSREARSVVGFAVESL